MGLGAESFNPDYNIASTLGKKNKFGIIKYTPIQLPQFK